MASIFTLLSGAASRRISSSTPVWQRVLMTCLLLWGISALLLPARAQTISTQIVDRGIYNNVGLSIRLVVVNGNPAISYYDQDSKDLKYARNSAADGSGTWNVITVQSQGDVGQFNSLAIVNGNPAISYLDRTNLKLKYVRALDANGSSFGTPLTVDSIGIVGRTETIVGQYTSLAVVNGYPAIGYLDATNFNGTNFDSAYSSLKYVRAVDVNGSGFGTPLTIDNNGLVGAFASMAVVNGNPAISYVDYTNLDLKYVRAVDVNGSSFGAPLIVDSAGDVGQYASLAVVNGNPAISYLDITNYDLKYVRALDVNGSSFGTPLIVDSAGTVGFYNSLSVVNGSPAISYFDSTNVNLKYVRALNANGSSFGTPLTVDSAGDVGRQTSLAVVNGNPAISYLDDNRMAVKYATIFTSPNFAPTDIKLSNQSVAENAGANAVVGNLTASDPDNGDTLSFSLPSGEENNALFNIDGTTLRATSSFDYEIANTYTVKVRVTDPSSQTYDESFTISVGNVNEAPVISTATLPDSQLNAAYAQTLSATDPDAADTLTWSKTVGTLPPGLTLSSGGLLAGSPTQTGIFNFTVQVSDGHGGTDTQALTLTVQGADTTAPTVVFKTPAQNQSLVIANFNAITGNATDNFGVTEVALKLFRIRNGVSQFWNGTNFGSDQTRITATLATPGALSTTWTYPISAQLRAALAAETYYAVAYGKDEANNTGAPVGLTFSLFKDTSAPGMVISSPSQNQDLSFAAFNAVSGSANDNVGVSQVLIKLFRIRSGVSEFWNGSSFGTAQTLLEVNVANPGSTGTTWSYPISGTLKLALDNGPYLIAGYARDATGNQSPAVGRNFLLHSDGTAPTATTTSPMQNQNLPKSSFTAVSGSASDNEGVTQVSIRLFRVRSGVTEFWNGSSFGAAPILLPVTLTSAGATTTTWNYPVSSALAAALDSGPYLLVAYARDAVGNQSAAAGRNFTLTNNAPLNAPLMQRPDSAPAS